MTDQINQSELNVFFGIEEFAPLTDENDTEENDVDFGEFSDGHHTFNELYYHRCVLFAVILNTYKDKYRTYKSWKHFDEEEVPMYDNMFVVGIETPKGQYNYHYHSQFWNLFDVPEVERAPKFDGHKPVDVDRLLSLLEQPNSGWFTKTEAYERAQQFMNE